MTTFGRVLIVEDHELLADSLRLALAGEGWWADVAELTSPGDVVADVVRDPPDLVLLDLDLGPAVGDGTALIPALRAAGASVLVVTGSTERTRIAAALEAGAVGYVSKTESFDELLDLTVRAAQGRSVLDPNERHELLAALRLARRERQERLTPFERLTARERQVLAALGNGKCVETIAAEWTVSEATVRSQVRAVLTKLDVGSQLAAVAKARAAGWFSVG